MKARLNGRNVLRTLIGVLGVAGLTGAVLLATANHVRIADREGRSPRSGAVVSQTGKIAAANRDTHPGLRPAMARNFQQLPAALVPVISATLGSHDAHYRINGVGAAYSTDNPANHMTVSFNADGLDLQRRHAHWGMKLVGYGDDENLMKSARVAPHAVANRVEYAHKGLTECYVNGPAGLEQSFRIAQAPWGKNSGQHTLALSFSLTGSWGNSESARSQSLTLLDDKGHPALRYTGLNVHDASGRKLTSWMEVRDHGMELRVAAQGAQFPVTVDPTYSEIAQLSQTSSPGNSFFGFSIAVNDDGTVAVVGECGLDVPTDSCSNSIDGEVFVFVEPTTGWTTTTLPAAILTSSDDLPGKAPDGFGSAVAINAAGNTILVSAPKHDCQTISNVLQCMGEAYVFSVPTSMDWPSVGNPAILNATSSAIGDFFASSIAMDQAGDTIVARELDPSTNVGHVNVYVRPGNSWASANETAQLESSNVAGSDNFGIGLGISGDGKTVVVGASAASTTDGEAYVFLEPTSPGGWSSVSGPIMESAKLLNSDPTQNGNLGNSAALDQNGDTVVVGASGQNFQGGEAYVYVVPSGSGGWSVDGSILQETARLEPSTSTFTSSLGIDVSISDDGSTIAVGSDAGGVYVFSEPSGGWPTGTPTPMLGNFVELIPDTTSGTSGVTTFHGHVSGNAVAGGTPGTILVSFPANDSGEGTVFVYGTSGGTTVTETIAAASGSGQTATVSTAFSAPLVATVVNGSGTGVSGVTVTFAAPTSGASGTFAGGVDTAVTDATGTATSAVFTANAIAGPYTVTATAPGAIGTASFSLTNQAAQTETIAATSGSGQTATVSTAFSAPLVAKVVNGSGAGVSGVTVTFAAPTSGASGTFAGGVNTAVTGATGTATSAVFTANAIAGPYTVTATAPGATGTASFSLTNQAAQTETIAATSGSGQTATVSTAFSASLVAKVVNGSGTGVSGVTVTFAAPTSGASGTFAGGVDTAVTGATGTATSAVFTANAIAGPYTVTATAPGATGTASFSLTNQAAQVATTTTTTITSASSSFHSFPLPPNDDLVDGPPVTVTFTVVQASGSTAPTGTVRVTDGFGDTCTTTTLTGGAGTCAIGTISQFGSGSTPLTATYTPFANSAFLSSTSSPVTENLVEVFAPCAAFSNPPPVRSGITTTITLTVCLAGNVTVVPQVAVVTDCIPRGDCSLAITPIAGEPGAYTVTVTIVATDAGVKGSLPVSQPRRGPWLLTVFGFVALLVMLMSLQLAQQNRTRLRLSCAAGLLSVVLLGGMSSCNGPSGTPAGSYTVDVTITAGQFNIVVPVIVQVIK